MEVEYESHDANTSCWGYKLNSDFGRYLSDRVGPRYRDDEGDQLLSDMDSMSRVGFDSGVLKATVTYVPSKVAEVLAECFLMDNHGTLIPYNRLRDSINPKGSMHGPDIIGIVGALFVFGETKSSSDPRHPPHVVYGPSGLIAQMDSIKHDREKRSRLIRWLGHKVRQISSGANHAAWLRAKRQYCESEGRAFKMCGMLIRDTEPDERDVTRVRDRVSADMHPSTLLDVMALYIPVPMQRLSSMVI